MMVQYGYTPLHCAAERGHTEIVCLLIGNSKRKEDSVSILVYIFNLLCIINTNLIIIKCHYLYMIGQKGYISLHKKTDEGYTKIAFLLIVSLLIASLLTATLFIASLLIAALLIAPLLIGNWAYIIGHRKSGTSIYYVSISIFIYDMSSVLISSL